MKTNAEKRKGFNIIEIMIVVSILGIIAAIVIPGFVTYKEEATSVRIESKLLKTETVKKLPPMRLTDRRSKLN